MTIRLPSDRQYVRVDASLPDDPKVLTVGWDGEHLLVRAMLWSKRTGGDGWVPALALPMLARGYEGDPLALTDSLERTGLWVPDRDGWTMPAWGKWQVTRADVDVLQARASNGGKATQARARSTRAHGVDKHGG